MIKLVFVHGWSVTNTSTYGDMPEALAARAEAAGLELDILNIHLGRYISFHDEVTVDDIARAFDRAVRETLGGATDADIPEFSCITHSTGGPVVREWVDRFYGKDKLGELPLKHLIMLAPANHGSALAALGKERVGRLKAWMSGVEPGQRVLDWLSLGSNESWQLAENQLGYDAANNGYYAFVVAGETIDRAFYDFLNNYLTEKGSDGVVRVAGCNMNYRFVTLRQTNTPMNKKTFTLEIDGPIRQPEPSALAIVPNASHSGNKIGIMTSITPVNANEKPVVDIVLSCLGTQTPDTYSARVAAMQTITNTTQEYHEKQSRYGMLVFQVCDDRGEMIEDYDLLLLAGKRYRPGDLPKGFFVDKQKNRNSGRLVYYIDADVLTKKAKHIGFRVTARPEKGFSHYAPAEFRSEDIQVADLVRPNETTYVNIVLKRRVAKNVFRLGPTSEKPKSFKKEKPDHDIL